MERHMPKNCNATDLHDKKIVTGATSHRSTGHTGNRIPEKKRPKVRRGNRSQPFFTGEEGENAGDKSRPSIMTDAMPETKTGRMRPKPVRGLNDGEGNHLNCILCTYV
ncbi:unnamed protein product [Brassica napus]|uniref:(rape) hypothetical protein n=1 Tax=Brassica napus TaxID=3708 RepID=A0A816N2J6_BRANA|nr:unnamed protein product [Brassica napus]